jgi:hypothetical protein
VSLYGHESKGTVLNVINLPYTPLRSQSRTLYVVKNSLTLREGIAIAVSARVFREINGKPNPDFRKVKTTYKVDDSDVSVLTGVSNI